MLATVFYREFKKTIKSPAFYLLLLLSAFLTYQDVSNDVIGRTMFNGFGRAEHNAPLFIAKNFALITFLTLIFHIVLVARSVLKDIDARVHPFYFTLPISKSAYLLGRFFGGFISLPIAYLGIVLGFFIAGVDLRDNLIGEHRFLAYLTGYLEFSLPTAFFLSSVFFSFASLSRRMFVTYALGVGCMLLFGVFRSGITSLQEDQFFNILFDPSGLIYLNQISADWTVSDINNRLVPFEASFILNRLLLLVLSSGLLIFTAFKFKRIENKEGKKDKKPRHSPYITPSKPKILNIASPIYSKKIRLKQFMHLSWKDAKKIIFHPAFLVVTFLALKLLYNNFTANVGPNGSNVYAITSWYLRFVDEGYGYILPLTIFFGGMLLWKERDQRTDSFYNTIALPSWMSYLSKLFVLVIVQGFYVLSVFLTGIFLQMVVFHYADIEPLLYAKRLLGIEMINYWHIAVLVLLIHTLSNNKYLGFFLCALYYALDIFIFDVNELGSELIRYGALPGFIYSNLNGFGHFADALIAYRVYWIFPAGILMILTYLFWVRGTETSFKSRIKNARQKLNSGIWLSLIVLVVLTAFTGGYIYYNNKVLNKGYTTEDIEESRADYEKTFKEEFEFMAQPSITDITLNVDLFPADRDCLIYGTYTMRNNSNKPITKVLVSLSDEYISHISILELKGAKLSQTDKRSWYRVYSTDNPLLPGDSCQLEFAYEIIINGFSVDNPKNAITTNGVFIGTIDGPAFFPTIGYNRSFELSGEQSRKEHGLPDRKLLTPLGDSFYTNKPPNALVNYRATISTDPDQMVITNGELQKEWQESKRRYFEYKTNSPINHAIGIISGKYEVIEENFNGVSLKVYYDEKHHYNIGSMMMGMKVALKYCSENYSEYPHKSARVVEVSNVTYPGTGTALSIPTIFAWQEYGGFISNLEDTATMNVVFNTTTHEFAHQWWAHTVRPALVEGKGILTEGMAQWVRIMCLEHEFGRAKVLEYLDDQINAYFRWRKRDYHGEQALIKARNQGYLLYNKSAIVMYALKEYIGEDKVNAALKKLVDRFGLKEEGPFPTTIDLVKELRLVTPDSSQYIITDLFEKIILYDHSVESATVNQESAAYLLEVEINSHKLEADSLGAETEIAMQDYIPLRILDLSGEALYDNKVKLKSGRNRLEFNFEAEPAEVMVDPDQILIERKREDNSRKISEISTLNNDY